MEGMMFRYLSAMLIILSAGVLICFYPAHAADRFTDNGDGTVTDHKLGLMGSKTDNHGDVNWNQAERWVKYTFAYTLAKKYDNWLPAAGIWQNNFERSGVASGKRPVASFISG
ncbi:MAG: hypothetical protein PVF26_01935 [Desulfobacterales bacterium]|jgi:hypothetical protein